MTRARLIEMIQLQEKFNTAVDADWRNDENRSDLTAMLVECGELIDHMGYKWWKKQTVDIEQARMEVVDIWHFLLSDAIRGMQKTFIDEMPVDDETFDGFLEMLEACEPAEEINNRLVFATCHALMAGTAMAASDFKIAVEDEAVDGRVLILSGFKQLMDALQMTSEDLYTQYIAKNALNHFRQQNGYKDGSYIKEWDGCEDNEHLTSIVKTLLLDNVTDLFGKCLEAMQYEYNLNAK